MKACRMGNRTARAAALALAMALFSRAAGTDLNGDKVVDIGDAETFLKSVAAGSPPDKSHDLDGDGSVGLSDALLYGRWINGLYEKPSAGLSTLYFKNPADTAAYSAYQKNAKAYAGWTMADLRNRYPVATMAPPVIAPGTMQFETEVGIGLDKFKAAGFNKAGFMSQLRSQGAVVSRSIKFPNYFVAMDQIHQYDLPVLITTDALLHSVYLSYDNILAELEETLLAGSLESILSASYDYAGKVYGPEQHGKDVLELTGTALFLLNRNRGDVEKTASIATHLKDIDDQLMRGTRIFGQDTNIDYSQFKPRGHYTRTPKLAAYFQAMMWLSRADLSFDLRAQAPGKTDPKFTRMKKDALTLWDCVINSGSYPAWLEFNRYVEYLVGMSDGLNMKGMGSVAQGLGVKGVPEFLKAFPEARFDSVVKAGSYGAQAILSQAKTFDAGAADPDLSPIFSFMPQRFILDSYTFSQAVFPITGELMPSSLQISFALGDNSSAVDAPEPTGAIGPKNLPGILGAQRALYDGISAEGWQSNMYTSWLAFLRKLNGAETNPKAAPAFRSPAWRKKMRNTQLASWAQLRHNTILYAKQSYTGGITCSFPKAYVEPYPEFFAAVAAYARIGAATFKAGRPAVASYFAELESICGKLKEAAERTSLGQSPTEAQAIWLTSALQSKPPMGCGGSRVYDGWFMDLFYKPKADLEYSTDYTIADVHTHPADDAGPDMVLHVASGEINLAAVAVQEDSCVTLYVGPVGSFYEVNRTGTLERYNDEEWTAAIKAGTAIVKRPAWAESFMGP
jgi:hypothetical protein